METEPIKYFLYARRSIEKSDREEKVASVESQIKEMIDIAKDLNLKIVEIFQETKSAKEPYVRPEFERMIKQIKEGKANGIICWKIDRLARNPVDEGTVKYLLQKGIIKNIKASDRDWYPDDNVLLASVEFGVATQYSRDLSKHIKRGMRARLESGVRPSIAPLGYKNSKYHEKGKEEILVDEERFPLVRKLFDLMLTSAYTVPMLLKESKKIGLTRRYTKNPNKPICESNLYRILTNPFYYGEFEFPEKSGNWYWGSHKPMITKEEYDRIQFLLSNKGGPRPRNHLFPYSGLIKCAECGATVTVEEKWKRQKNGNTHHYTYYHCTKKIKRDCTQKAVREEEIEKQILEILKEIEIPQLFRIWAVESLKEIHQKEKQDRDGVLTIKRKEYDRLNEKLESLLDLRLANELSPEEYQNKKSSLERQKQTLKNTLDDIDSKIDTWLKEIEESFDFAEKARTEFEKGSFDKKRMTLATLGYNRTLKDRKLNMDFTKPLEIIKKSAFEARRIDHRLEPPKSVAVQRQITQKYENNSLMWTIPESNRSPLPCHGSALPNELMAPHPENFKSNYF